MEKEIFQFFFGISNDLLLVNIIITFFASYFIYALLGAALIFIVKQLTWRKKFFSFLFVGLNIIISRIIVHIIKVFYNSPRPNEMMNLPALVEAGGNSFPSGHTAFLFSLSLPILIINKKWGVVFLILSLFAGIARVSAGVHWASDILGGIMISIISFGLVMVALKKPVSEILKRQKESLGFENPETN